MGSSASKAARNAIPSTRRYPTRIPQNEKPLPGAVAARSVSATETAEVPRAEALEGSEVSDTTTDVSQSALDSRLRSIGPVRPIPHFSPSSQSPLDPQPDAVASPLNTHFRMLETNPALAILSARQQFQEAADAEFNAIGRKGFVGRRLFDAGTIRQALVLRDERGMTEPEIERMIGAKVGVLGVLGPQGLVSAASTPGEGFGERGHEAL